MTATLPARRLPWAEIVEEPKTVKAEARRGKSDVRAAAVLRPTPRTLEREGGPDTEEPVSSAREGEERIKEETPSSPARDTRRDTPVSDA